MCINISGQLTVYFDCPFWVGVFEIYEKNTIRTCKIVFGSEPKDNEIYELILREYYDLKFSVPIPLDDNYQRPKAVNPKRLQRQIQKSIENKGIGTKAQQTIQRQRELNKVERKSISKLKKEEETNRRYRLKQLKKKSKKRGH